MSKALFLDLPGRSLAIAVKRSGTARRMSLRLDPLGGVVVVLPVGVPVAEAERFARRQRDWIAGRLAALPGRIALVPGTAVPLLGVAHDIRHAPEARRGVWAEGGALHVSGRAEHVGRRVVDFLKAEARRQIAPRCQAMAERIGAKVGRLSMRDTRSRWGSCTAGGDLAFSWRLVMAPEWVLTYVVAHEVAHLAELNHGPRFWAVVADLADDPGPPRAWLKRHGPELHRYG
ncbi:MAG: M48 family metallopeptidase [Magnetospirillum sp.]|nr:M48 family metallopeptidase [Magnetospirillum sp.]